MDQLMNNASSIEIANAFSEFLRKVTEDLKNQNEVIANLNDRVEEAEKNLKDSNERVLKLEEDIDK